MESSTSSESLLTSRFSPISGNSSDTLDRVLHEVKEEDSHRKALKAEYAANENLIMEKNKELMRLEGEDFSPLLAALVFGSTILSLRWVCFFFFFLQP